jgi:U3 small nucleolar RNA-associated protein 4
VSWWNTELRIWRVKPQGDVEKPKVVARLALQGEENISSATITQDGGLLAISTTSTVKLFQLIRPQSGAGTGLRIRKLEMPHVNGAKTVKLSPNGKWLSAINATNDIQLVRIVRTEDPTDLPRALNKLQQLYRLERKDLPETQLSGPTGAYERSIAHAEFSQEGNVFAVVDIAGYIDTWVIEGHEDSTAPEVDIDNSAMAVQEPDESDDEEVEKREHITFLGQHWAQNPSGHLIPRLDSTPVLLSFQPNSSDHDRPQPNGNPALHPTRHNPHPHSHELPKTDYRLLLVSAEHQMYLFDVMAGRLSEWSRRNPPSSYPREYQQLDLPAKGCIWDVNTMQQRIWLYGEKWLFMFDLTKNFAISGSESVTSLKKRKRNVLKNKSGAGDVIPQAEAPVTKMRRFDNQNETGKSKWTDLTTTSRIDADDEDAEDDNSQPLATLRRGSTQNGVPKMVDEAGGDGEEMVDKQKRSEPWWHTFKYRPILGILSIGAEGGATPEVVLVERPSWDLDLPPRFVGTHEQ